MIGLCSTKGATRMRKVKCRRRAVLRFAAKDAPAHTAPAPICSWQRGQAQKSHGGFSVGFRASEESWNNLRPRLTESLLLV